MSRAHAPQQQPLYKQQSWSPDSCRDETWLRRKGNWKKNQHRSKSVTDDDVEELKGCIELGFGFKPSPEVELDHRLSLTLPALDLYYDVNKTYNNSLLSSSAVIATVPPPTDSNSNPSPQGSPHTAIIGHGDSPQTVKTRLRHWAQVVACAVRQSAC